MSNKANHRRKTQRREHGRARACSCAGEGANGARGKARWKQIAKRAARHRTKLATTPRVLRKNDGRTRKMRGPLIEERS